MTAATLTRSPQCKGINTHRGCTQAFRPAPGEAVEHCDCVCHNPDPARIDRAAAVLYAQDPGSGAGETDARDEVLASVIADGVTMIPALRLVSDTDAGVDVLAATEAELAIVRDERDVLAQAYSLAMDELQHYRTQAGVFAGREFDRAVQAVIDRKATEDHEAAVLRIGQACQERERVQVEAAREPQEDEAMSKSGMLRERDLRELPTQRRRASDGPW